MHQYLHKGVERDLGYICRPGQGKSSSSQNYPRVPYGPSLMDFAGWIFEVLLLGKEVIFLSGQKYLELKIFCSNITGLDITSANHWVFNMERLSRGANIPFFFSLPVICPFAYFRLLSTGSAALGSLKNKLSVNDGYFSYFH